MSGNRKLLEWTALGGCAFVLTQAILAMVLSPGDKLTDGNPIWKLVLAVSYLGVVAILVPHYREALFIGHRNWPLVALLLLALVSCIWANMPGLVLQRSVAVFGTTLFGIALAVVLSVEDQLRLMSRVFRIIAVLSLACCVLTPQYGIMTGADAHGEWRGIFDQKNGLGSVMALSVLVEWQLPAQTIFSKLLKLSALLASSVLLVFSDSITAIVCVIACFIFVQIYKVAMRIIRSPLMAIGLAALLVAAPSVALRVADSEGVTAALGRSSDLTGRTEIWNRVISYILDRPVLGYGYSGFWYGASPESAAIDRVMGTRIMYSHNGFLDIVLTLGVVGLLLVLAFLATGIRRAFELSERDRQSSVSLYPLAFLSFFLLHNLTEGSILLQNLEWALCVAVIVGADAAVFANEAAEEELPIGEEFP